MLQSGPASAGGLRPGDVVVAIGGAPVTNTAQLLNAVAALKPKAVDSVYCGVQRVTVRKRGQIDVVTAIHAKNAGHVDCFGHIDRRDGSMGELRPYKRDVHRAGHVDVFDVHAALGEHPLVFHTHHSVSQNARHRVLLRSGFLT